MQAKYPFSLSKIGKRVAMERKGLRGASLLSSSPPNSEEHIIQILNLEAELLPQQSEDQQPPLLSQSQISQQPRTSPRRVLPNFNSDFNPTTFSPAFINNHYHHNNHHRFSSFRACSLFVPPRVLHAIPLFILLSFTLLCAFAIKDGRVIEHFSIRRPFSLNDTELTLSHMAILAVATSPYPNIELILSMINN